MSQRGPASPCAGEPRPSSVAAPEFRITTRGSRRPKLDAEGHRRDHLPHSAREGCALGILPVGSRDVG